MPLAVCSDPGRRPSPLCRRVCLCWLLLGSGSPHSQLLPSAPAQVRLLCCLMCDTV